MSEAYAGRSPSIETKISLEEAAFDSSVVTVSTAEAAAGSSSWVRVIFSIANLAFSDTKEIVCSPASK